MKRITPLNIITACLLIWLGMGIIDKTLAMSSVLWILLLVVIIVIGDQIFRMTLGSIKRIWVVQALFILITIGTAYMIWYIKS